MVHYIVSENDPQTSGLEAPYIKLYTAATPNGFKVTALLELLGLDYYVRPIDIMSAECKEPWYLKFNPNGRIPSLTHADDSGNVNHINESAAIMMYLCDKFDKDYKFSFPHGSSEYYEMLEWTFFQMAGLGPMKGQFHWFTFAARKGNVDEFAIDRYKKETIRLFGVLEDRLEREKSGFLVGGKLSIADLCSYPWIVAMKLDELENFPRLVQWVDRLGEIPEIKSGMAIPAPKK
ncbi:hypothetical protein DAMA08_022280 [Martiniozyma asiatica (nom. inval.)]|nr:hypothetical protein DAMA08_022280 [Martiniozyma asiatica]